MQKYDFIGSLKHLQQLFLFTKQFVASDNKAMTLLIVSSSLSDFLQLLIKRNENSPLLNYAKGNISRLGTIIQAWNILNSILLLLL